MSEPQSTIVTIERPARKSGGDRYAEGDKPSPIFGTLYINQTYSRREGQPVKAFKVTIEEL